MNPGGVVRRQREVIWRAVDDRVVGLDLRTSRYFSLNNSAAVLWAQLEGDVGVDELAELLVDRYGIERATAHRDVEAFLDEMRSTGLLEE
ncbi:MAG TPA: hypothetical protein DCQ30_12965 [Acidimicrobiaceae bacterium]|nr:hypothetical protein [Acidimicrobiaceae bacterium]